MDFLEKAIAKAQNDEIELLETTPESLPQADKTVDSFCLYANKSYCSK
ncbi:hypothetical protein [Methylocucumis oryzae]|nr:hypothetical protein [Methylocucumis oryzae]